VKHTLKLHNDYQLLSQLNVRITCSLIALHIPPYMHIDCL